MSFAASPAFEETVVTDVGASTRIDAFGYVNRPVSRPHYRSVNMELLSPLLGKTPLPIAATNDDLSEKISGIVIQIPVKHLSKAAHRTPEAAKKWRTGYSCPDLASTINLARSIPAIKYLIYREIEQGTPDGIYSPKLFVEALALLSKIASGENEHAETARAILSGNLAGGQE